MFELFITFSIRGELEKIMLNDIDYIINDGRKVQVHSDEPTRLYYDSVRKVLPRLDERFYNCHCNLVVNLARVDAIDDGEVRFLNGSSVPVGVHNLRQTRQAYESYLVETARKMRMSKMGKRNGVYH